MMRLKLRKKKKNNVIGKILFLMTVILISSFFVVKIFDNRVKPILLSYAESKTRKLTTLIINRTVTKQITLNMNTDNLYNIEKNSNGEIEIVNFNSIEVNKISNSITNLVQLNLKAIEEGNVDLLELPDSSLQDFDKEKMRSGIIYEVPFGAITNISMLSNLGQKIPVKLHLVGDVETGIRSDLKEYGINNALLEIGVTIKVTCRINMPFISELVEVENTVPLVIKLVQGKVPEYYLNGFGNRN